jgi:multicomponent Na+:H+ antiporter subunit F
LNKTKLMNQFLHIVLYIQIALCFFCLYRIIKGPTIPDRMVGIDIFGILVVGICAIIAVITDRMFIIDIGIAWIILSFIGTLTLAKYLGGRKLNE